MVNLLKVPPCGCKHCAAGEDSPGEPAAVADAFPLPAAVAVPLAAAIPLPAAVAADMSIDGVLKDMQNIIQAVPMES